MENHILSINQKPCGRKSLENQATVAMAQIFLGFGTANCDVLFQYTFGPCLCNPLTYSVSSFSLNEQALLELQPICFTQ